MSGGKEEDESDKLLSSRILPSESWERKKSQQMSAKGGERDRGYLSISNILKKV